MTDDNAADEYDARADQLIEQFNGNARDVVKALMQDMDVLLRSYRKDASSGYCRRGSALDRSPFPPSS